MNCRRAVILRDHSPPYVVLRSGSIDRRLDSEGKRLVHPKLMMTAMDAVHRPGGI